MALADKLFGQHVAMVSDDDFQVLLAANAMGALGTALISPVLNSLTGPFNVSSAEIGLLVTAITAPAIVLIPLSGLVADRIGRKPVLVSGLLCFGFGGLSIAFTTDFYVALGLRVLQGIGFAGITPIIITSLGDLYSGGVEATAQGIRFGVSGLSQAVFPAIAGVVVAFGWQYPFVIYGISIPIAVLIAFFFDEPTTDEAAASSETSREENYIHQLKRLVFQSYVAWYLVARGIVVMPFFAFLTYNSLVISQLQSGSSVQAGLIVALFSIVYAITATQAGRITALFERRMIPLVVANLLLGGGLAGFAVSTSVFYAVLPVIAMGIGVGITFSLYRSIITALAPQELRGGLVSISESGARLIASLTPVGVGITLTWFEPTLGTSASLRVILVAAGILAAASGCFSIILAQRLSPNSTTI